MCLSRQAISGKADFDHRRRPAAAATREESAQRATASKLTRGRVFERRVLQELAVSSTALAAAARRSTGTARDKRAAVSHEALTEIACRERPVRNQLGLWLALHRIKESYACCAPQGSMRPRAPFRGARPRGITLVECIACEINAASSSVTPRPPPVHSQPTGSEKH